MPETSCVPHCLKSVELGCIRGERPVFGGLSFTVNEGETLLLTGPNGSGKSSLLRLLAGLLAPAIGWLEWDGVPISRDRDAHRARLRYVGHQDAVKPNLTTLEHLRFWGRLLDAEETRVHLALDGFGLTDLADRPGRQLSAGQRRRLALARLLLAPAPLWLLDEPSVGLDRDAGEALAEVLGNHLHAGGLLIVASHVPLAGTPTPDQALDLGDFQVAPPDPAEIEELLG